MPSRRTCRSPAPPATPPARRREGIANGGTPRDANFVAALATALALAERPKERCALDARVTSRDSSTDVSDTQAKDLAAMPFVVHRQGYVTPASGDRSPRSPLFA